MINQLSIVYQEIQSLLDKSPALKDIGQGTKSIIAYNIADFVESNYKLVPKKVWYGVDIEHKINQLKQQLAIFTAYKRRNACPKPQPTEKQIVMWTSNT
jgi:hypothetical protein